MLLDDADAIHIAHAQHILGKMLHIAVNKDAHAIDHLDLDFIGWDAVKAQDFCGARVAMNHRIALAIQKDIGNVCLPKIVGRLHIIGCDVDQPSHAVV